MGKSEYTKKREQAPLQLSKGEALDKTAPENKASAFAAPETPCPDIQDEPNENGTARAGIGEKIAAAFRGRPDFLPEAPTGKPSTGTSKSDTWRFRSKCSMRLLAM